MDRSRVTHLMNDGFGKLAESKRALKSERPAVLLSIKPLEKARWARSTVFAIYLPIAKQ
jgi:uncharacterized protein (DUF2132 family)